MSDQLSQEEMEDMGLEAEQVFNCLLRSNYIINLI